MGLFSSIKKMVNEVAAPSAVVASPPEPEEVDEQEEQEECASDDTYDLAGFDPDDENAFFDAERHMESEGVGGGTDASRAEVMARFGIRDRSHWHTVKASVYQALIEKYGDEDVVSQRHSNYLMGAMQQRMQQNTAAVAASGELNPVEGISLSQWAGINAAIVAGANFEDLLKGSGIDKARWDRVRSEWEARMTRDTTFAIATAYGNAFQAASAGKYSSYAKEANAARAANRELSMPPPMGLDQYYDIMFEQAYASKQGKDAAEALKAMGLSIVDWCDLSSYMGYHFHRTWAANVETYQESIKRAEAKCAAKYPGVKADVDISF